MLKIWNDYDRESENPPRTGHRPLGRTADAGLAAAAVDDPLGRAPQGGGRRGRQRRALVRRRSVRTLWARSEEHTSELQSLMRTSYAVFCLKKKNTIRIKTMTDKNTSTN